MVGYQMAVVFRFDRSYDEPPNGPMREGFIHAWTCNQSHDIGFRNALDSLYDMSLVIAGSHMVYKDPWQDVLDIHRDGDKMYIEIYRTTRSRIEVSGHIAVDDFRRFIRNAFAMCIGSSRQVITTISADTSVKLIKI